MHRKVIKKSNLVKGENQMKGVANCDNKWSKFNHWILYE